MRSYRAARFRRPPARGRARRLRSSAGASGIRVFLGDELVLSDEGRQEPDPFRVFRVTRELQAGLSRITVVVADTENTNWLWNGFSLVIHSALGEEELLYLS